MRVFLLVFLETNPRKGTLQSIHIPIWPVNNPRGLTKVTALASRSRRCRRRRSSSVCVCCGRPERRRSQGGLALCGEARKPSKFAVSLWLSGKGVLNKTEGVFGRIVQLMPQVPSSRKRFGCAFCGFHLFFSTLLTFYRGGTTKTTSKPFSRLRLEGCPQRQHSCLRPPGLPDVSFV